MKTPLECHILSKISCGYSCTSFFRESKSLETQGAEDAQPGAALVPAKRSEQRLLGWEPIPAV